MVTTIEDLSKALEEFFSKKFPVANDGGPGSMALVFDGLGTPLAMNEFIGSGEGAAQNLISHQRAAQLADQIPSGNSLRQGWYLPRSNGRFSRWYQEILAGSSTKATSDEGIRGFERRRHAAALQFAANKLAAVSGSAVGGVAGTAEPTGTLLDYYSTGMTPVGWYMTNADTWASYEIGSGAEPPAPEPEPVRPTWNVPDAPVVPVGDNPRPWLVSAPFSLRTTDELLVRQNPNLSEFVEKSLLYQQVELTDPVPNLRPRHPLASITETTDSLLTVRRWRSHLENTINESSQVHPPKASLGQLIASANFLDPITIITATRQNSVTSSEFKLSFQYVLVRFTRPWLDDVFLSTRDWCLPGYEAGGLASGSMQDARDPVTLVTSGMIVVKDLKMSAAWTEQDLQGLAEGVSFGPFSLAGASLPTSHDGALERSGMQVIAWLCEVPPEIPPINA